MTRVLVVEDSATQAKALEIIFQAEGFEVQVAHDGEQALAALRTEPSDVVVTDVNMPRMGGYELCRHIKADPSLRSTPVVLLTALTEPMAIVEGLECGADHFVSKPYQPETLLARVRGILEIRRLRASEPAADAVRIQFQGKTFRIASTKEQILDLLIATFEDIVRTNRELQQSQQELAAAKASLEDHAHRLEGRVRSSEERYQRLLAQAQDGILLLDRDGRVLEVNHHGETLFGLHADALVGRTYFELLPEEERDYGRLQFGKLTADGVVRIEDAYLQRPDGTRVSIEVSASVVEVEGRQVVLAILRDVTERLQHQRQVAQSEKLATVGALAAGIAHEINNPTTYVLANLAMLEEFDGPLRRLGDGLRELSRRLPEPARQELESLLDAVPDGLLGPDYAEVVRESVHGAERIRDIVGDLKSFAHMDGERTEPVDLTERLDAALRMASHELKYRARVERDYDPEVPPVKGIPGRLLQLFVNLIVNAAQAMETGGPGENVLRLSTGREGARVRIDVADTGKGIAASVLPHVFDPFFTTKPVGQGTGLGLSISQEIVQKHGGEITVRSEVGRGTTFTLWLPIDRGGTVAAGPATTAEVTLPRLRVLAIDDEPHLLKLYLRLLGERHEVTTALGGRAAVEILGHGDLRFDVVLCDLMMPDTDGADLYGYVAAKLPGLEQRMVFVTGGAFTPKIQEFLDELHPATLEKPFDLQQLQQAMADVLARTATPPAG